MAKKRSPEEIGEKWDLLKTMLSGMYAEIDKLCKKKPDMLLSELKINKINDLITPIKELLSGENQFVERIDLIDVNTPLELSDVIIILSQMEAGLDAYRDKYRYYVDGILEWH